MDTETKGIGKKRLVIEMEPWEHRAVKAKALLLGMSMREYVLKTLREDDVFDMEDVSASVAEAIQEVKRYRAGEQGKPQSARSFLESL